MQVPRDRDRGCRLPVPEAAGPRDDRLPGEGGREQLPGTTRPRNWLRKHASEGMEDVYVRHRVLASERITQVQSTKSIPALHFPAGGLWNPDCVVRRVQL